MKSGGQTPEKGKPGTRRADLPSWEKSYEGSRGGGERRRRRSYIWGGMSLRGTQSRTEKDSGGEKRTCWQIILHREEREEEKGAGETQRNQTLKLPNERAGEGVQGIPPEGGGGGGGKKLNKSCTETKRTQRHLKPNDNTYQTSSEITRKNPINRRTVLWKYARKTTKNHEKGRSREEGEGVRKKGGRTD